MNDRCVSCDGKIPFDNRKDAVSGMVHLKKTKGSTCHVYFCRFCHHYHYGSTRQTRQDWHYRQQIKIIINLTDEDDDDDV